jgi:predicted nicotinamide N-methyase
MQPIASNFPLPFTSEHVRDDQKILARIQKQFAIEDTTTELNSQSYPWSRVIDPDRLLEEALSRKDRSSTDLDPFWAAHWRASIGLERFLDSLDIANQRVLDLGCGSGRVGIGAALRGAKVVMTDAVGAAMLIAKYNARFVRDRVQIRRLEWKEEQLPGPKFKMIFGSDIVYDPSLHSILEPCLRRHLTRDGVVYLSEPQRHTGDRFQRWIIAAGWNLSETYIDLDDGHRPVRIFSLSL